MTSRPNKIVFFLLCTTVVMTTLVYGTVHQPIIALFYALMVGMVIIWAADSFINGTVRFSGNLLQIPLFLLGVFGIIQVIPFGTISERAGISGIPRTLSIDPFSTETTAIHILALSAFFALSLAYINSAERLRRVMSVLTIFGFIYAFYAILQSVLSPDRIYGIYKPPVATPFGSFVNRNDFGATIEMVTSLALGAIFTGSVRGDKKMLYLVAVGLMATSLLLSGSRGGLIAFVAEIILLVILTSGTKGRKDILLKAALSSLLVMAAVGGAVFVGGDTSLSRFSDAANSDNLSSTRAQIWSVSVKVIADQMPFGAGLGAFGQAYTKFDPAGGALRVEQAHNDYLQIVADAGVVGLILGVCFLFLFVREVSRNVRVTNTFRRGIAAGAAAGCFAILVHSIFDFVLHITAISVMFITLMAMLVASGRKYADDIAELGPHKVKKRGSASVTSIEERQRRGV